MALTKRISNYWVRYTADGTNRIPAITVKVVVVNETCALTDGSQYLTAATLGEIATISGYTGGHGGAGRLTLSSVTMANDFGNDRVNLTAASLGWTLASGATFAGVVLHVPGTTGDTDAQLIGVVPVTVTPTNGGRISVTFSSNVFFRYGRAAGS